jgi:hypothetical protein
MDCGLVIPSHSQPDDYEIHQSTAVSRVEVEAQARKAHFRQAIGTPTLRTDRGGR